MASYTASGCSPTCSLAAGSDRRPRRGAGVGSPAIPTAIHPSVGRNYTKMPHQRANSLDPYRMISGHLILSTVAHIKRFFAKADCSWSLGFHPLDPLRPPLRCLEWLGEVPTVSPHLSVAQLED
jgi:hypothetical protein